MRGLTIVEVAILIVILVVAAAAVVVMLPHPPHDHRKLDCMNNVRNIVGLLEYATRQKAYPQLGGANLILWLATKGEIEGEDELRTLFCPGDTKESLEKAGGPKAYVGLDLETRGHDHLTSYAGRDLTRTGCSAQPGPAKPVVLVCDDSDDHHEDALIVGLTDGSVKLRKKLDDWGLDEDARVGVGSDSVVTELRCLRKD